MFPRFFLIEIDLAISPNINPTGEKNARIAQIGEGIFQGFLPVIRWYLYAPKNAKRAPMVPKKISSAIGCKPLSVHVSNFKIVSIVSLKHSCLYPSAILRERVICQSDIKI